MQPNKPWIVPGLLLAIALTSLYLLSHCGSDNSSDSSSGIEATFSSLYTNYFSSCGQAGCHREGTNAYDHINMDLSSASSAYTALTSTTLSNETSECAGKPILKADDPDNSLYFALGGTDLFRDTFAAANGNCYPTRFSSMPFTGETDEVKSALRTWILAGAENN